MEDAVVGPDFSLVGEDVLSAGMVDVVEGLKVTAASPVLWGYLQGAVVEEEEGHFGEAGFATVV